MFAKIQFASLPTREALLNLIKEGVAGTFTGVTVVEHIEGNVGWSVVNESATHLTVSLPSSNGTGTHYVKFAIESTSINFYYGDAYNPETNAISLNGVAQTTKSLFVSATSYSRNLIVSINPTRIVLSTVDQAVSGGRNFTGVFLGTSNLRSFGANGVPAVACLSTNGTWNIPLITMWYTTVTNTAGTICVYNSGHPSNPSKFTNTAGNPRISELAVQGSGSSIAAIKLPGIFIKDYLVLPDFEDVVVQGISYANMNDRSVTYNYLMTKE